jgi:hypothetical protein
MASRTRRSSRSSGLAGSQILGSTGSDANYGHLYGRAETTPSVKVRRTAWLAGGRYDRGLFAREDIPKHTKITPYAGELVFIHHEDVSGSEATHMVGLFTVDHTSQRGAQRLVIKGYKNPRDGYGLGSFVNHSETPNAKLVKNDHPIRAYIKATRLIRRGEEILISYGQHYFQRTRDGELTGDTVENPIVI